jgi:uncharacterized membrane protein
MVRVVYPGVLTWDDLLDLALLEIQQYGHDSYQVQRRLGALLRRLEADLPAVRVPALARHMRRREAAIEESFPHEGNESAVDDPQGLGHKLLPS